MLYQNCNKSSTWPESILVQNIPGNMFFSGNCKDVLKYLVALKESPPPSCKYLADANLFHPHIFVCPCGCAFLRITFFHEAIHYRLTTNLLYQFRYILKGTDELLAPHLFLLLPTIIILAQKVHPFQYFLGIRTMFEIGKQLNKFEFE